MKKSIRIARVERAHTNKKGFSLVEMILVVAISAIIALAVSQVFLSGTKSFEKNKEMGKNVEEGRAAMELMVKNVRMSKYLTNIVGTTAPFTITTTDTIYFYNNSQKKCVRYKFDNTAEKLRMALAEPNAADPINPTCVIAISKYDDVDSDLIPSNVTGNFYIVSTNRNSNPQAIGRATIRMTVGAGTNSEQTLQISASFRDYDDILQ